MLLFSLINNPIQFIGFLLALLLAITIHEFAHGWAAGFYGDPTAKLMGRLTLNPLAHLDLMGTIFLLLAGFGWGKPVVINSNNFKNPKLDNLTVSLAGPLSNLLLAVVLGLVYRVLNLPTLLEGFIVLIVFFNLVLMIFNLLPIPPLDGSHILALFMSEKNFLTLQQIGIPLLFFIIIFSGLFFPIIPLFISTTVSLFFILLAGKPALH